MLSLKGFLEPFFTDTTDTDVIYTLGMVPGDGHVLNLINIPEPGTLAILGLGLAGLGLARRRKQAT